MIDLFDNSHVQAALYFTDQGSYIFKRKNQNGNLSKSIREEGVRAAFTQAGKDSGWLSAGVLRVGNNSSGPWFVHFTAPQKVKITLASMGEIIFPAPALLLAGYNGRFHFFAAAEDHFKPEMPLYCAPFPNLGLDGAICWGINIIPAVNAFEIEKVYKLFFEAPFNSHNANGKSKSCPDDIRTFLVKLAGEDTYPLDDLVSANITAGGLVNQIARGGGI